MVAEKRTELDDVCNMFISGADTNGNGVLDKEEARAWAVENGKEAKVEALFQHLDENNDDKISEAELKAFFNKAYDQALEIINAKFPQ
mmetsp:Transcript_3451/g.4575  ORF Transcript_3451/g.4575 Transcript_3451/m.4575 type:complete len:88 (+) Transcript_3451:122-385(+)